MQRSGPWDNRGITFLVVAVTIPLVILLLGIAITLSMKLFHSQSNAMERDRATAAQLSQFSIDHPPPKEKNGIFSLGTTYEALGLERSVVEKDRVSGGYAEMRAWLAISCVHYSLLHVGQTVSVDGEEQTLTAQDVRAYYAAARSVAKTNGDVCGIIPADPPLPIADTADKEFPISIPIIAVFMILGLLVLWRALKERPRGV